jgi:hypothetical protein
MTNDTVGRLLRAGTLTAIVDGTFACVLSLIYGSTITRLWQGVASVLLGPDALTGGTRTALIGVLMHIGVAFTWSAVFLLAMTQSAALRRLRQSPGGLLKVACIYGPFIWMVMSLAVIPALAHRPPAITSRWWVNFFGHIPFVAIPMLLGAGAMPERRPEVLRF